MIVIKNNLLLTITHYFFYIEEYIVSAHINADFYGICFSVDLYGGVYYLEYSHKVL